MNAARRWLVWLAVVAVAVGCNKPNPKQSVFQQLSLAEALQQAKADDKLVMIDFYADWCGYCDKLDDTTWKDAKVQAWLRGHVVPIKIDVDAEQDLAAKYQVRGLPTIVFLKPDGSEVERVGGYVDEDVFLQEVVPAVEKKAR